MEKFNEIPNNENLISGLFNSREEFRQCLEDALEWSYKGGPEVGSSSFMKSIFGNVKICGDDYVALKKIVYKEIGRIQKEKKKNDIYSKEEIEIISESARRQMLREAKRAGEDPDASELYPDKKD